ncbi:uncharacterized protein LOC115276141 [Suricata suricatta]|uniref:uncharacterized protein LOC115276141 n=1 Tax=Suricata suricatta TaxID=37032 RepID=UPI0011556A52|nr:uncharacterized protein LOC115276141 [Suricata suricatta]
MALAVAWCLRPDGGTRGQRGETDVVPAHRASYTGVPACQGSPGCARDTCAFPHSQFRGGAGGLGDSALGPVAGDPPRELLSRRVTAAGIHVVDTCAGIGETAVLGHTPGPLTRTLDAGPGVCIAARRSGDAFGTRIPACPAVADHPPHPSVAANSASEWDVLGAPSRSGTTHSPPSALQFQGRDMIPVTKQLENSKGAEMKIRLSCEDKHGCLY